MAIRYNAKEVVERLQKELKAGRPLFMPNCGMGLSAKLQEKGRADVICISPTSWWRLKGQGSLAAFLPYSDCNQIVFELTKEILPVLKETPAITLSGPHNPLLPHREHLQKLWDMGVSGVTPMPCKLYDKSFADQIEHIGMGWSREVEFIKVAHEMNMFTWSYVFSPEEATTFAEVGSDVISGHVGATQGGSVGAKAAMTLEEAAELTQKIIDAARKVKKDVIVFAHGGPIEGPKEVEYIYKNTGAQGFVGGSAAERIPLEKGVFESTETYKNIPFKNKI